MALEIMEGGTMVANQFSAGQSVGNIFSTFTEIFGSAFTLISGNSALAIILAVAVGLPILGGIIALFKGR